MVATQIFLDFSPGSQGENDPPFDQLYNMFQLGLPQPPTWGPVLDPKLVPFLFLQVDGLTCGKSCVINSARGGIGWNQRQRSAFDRKILRMCQKKGPPQQKSSGNDFF